jgi:hypothetical protein
MNAQKYKVGEIYGILEDIYNDLETRNTVVPLFMSNSGLGKTHIIEQFMRDKGVYRPPLVLSQRMPFEISGMALVERNNRWVATLLKGIDYIFKSFFRRKIEDPNFELFISTLDKVSQDRMRYYDFDFLLNLVDGDILFIDETYNANPLTLSAFLTFLESRIMISGRKLPNIMIVAAANPQGMPVLTPQIRRRFLQYDIEFDKVSWCKYMFEKYQLPYGVKYPIGEKLCNLIEREDFTGYNFNTPADLDKAVGMIIKGIKTPYDKEIKPILETIIDNTLGKIVDNSGNIILDENEKIKWLNFKQIINGKTRK